MLDGLVGLSPVSQLIATGIGFAVALISGYVVSGALDPVIGILLDAGKELIGVDLTTRKIPASPDIEAGWRICPLGESKG